MTRLLPAATMLALLAAAVPLAAQDADDAPPGPPDLMTFASGVLPVSVSTGAADLRTGPEQAIALIDGSANTFSLTPRPAGADDRIEIVYAMPAPTTFDGFAVPGILETPSPSQTFAARVEVAGSVTGPDGPFAPLAEATLETHAARGDVTALTLLGDPSPVLWVRVALSGGINVERAQTFLEFSELVGTGRREATPLSEGFDGVWRGRGVRIELAQQGATVTGCYDTDGDLRGTVDGAVLRAVGRTQAGIVSHFILIVAPDGGLRGLRSTNGAPFKPHDGAPSDAAPTCTAPATPVTGCGAVLHGIGFDFDSAAIRPESRPVLQALHAGLAGADAASIRIVGHSSSEGAADYNLDLSQRRAQSVVDALVGLGLSADRLSALGKGEAEPIASNADEAGRSLNRRVEILCSG